jgi:hypothetical protein
MIEHIRNKGGALHLRALRFAAFPGSKGKNRGPLRELIEALSAYATYGCIFSE